jgi:predicted AlkP superfamily pyrophosphatase or phosphodiesterase
MADETSSEWILDCARESIRRYDPDLLWVYVTHLDYDAQRHGPDSPEMRTAVETVDELVGGFLEWLSETDRWPETVVTVVNEYGFHAVEQPVFPNRALREAGLLAVTDDGAGGEEVDLPASRAFAMVDHQVAHVYTDAPEAARRALEPLDGVDDVLGPAGRAARGVDHAHTGDLVAVADRDAWFQYYWWTDHDDALYYATDMDIHAKPGYDPCELFVGEAGLASLDPTRISGSHGRVDEAAYGCFGLGGPAAPDGVFDDADAIDPGTGAVDARAVAPTVAALLGVTDAVSASMTFERPSLL